MQLGFLVVIAISGLLYNHQLMDKSDVFPDWSLLYLIGWNWIRDGASPRNFLVIALVGGKWLPVIYCFQMLSCKYKLPAKK